MSTTPIEFMVFDSDAMEFVDDERLLYFTVSDVRYDDPYNFMQLTALCSINDEAIYNHMIVKDNYGSFYLVDLHNYLWMFKLKCMELEIVGNRFQHPQLLELCK